MFGFEFASFKKIHTFPKYNEREAVDPNSIERITPLVWQEHCVECAMPFCYGICAHYKRRMDGRCRLFKYGIEKTRNKHSILGQNVVIDMNEWAKLETFFFPSSYDYELVARMNCLVSLLGACARFINWGKLRRAFYYIKEYITRKWGNKEKRIPDFLLCEFYNDGSAYSLSVESRANNQALYRTLLNIKKGYNRFFIPSSELKFLDGYVNYLCLYPEKNEPQIVKIISLALVSFKSGALDMYLPQVSKKVKCVVWDLDGTLWDGILAENGVQGIHLKKGIIDIIRELDARGIVNSICSKNYENEVLEVLRHFGIEEIFVCPVISWNAKSQGIKKIARALDIGLDTFVFVDDSFFELNEVKVNCLSVRTCNVKDIEEYIKKDFFDVPITEESRNRRKSYQDIVARNQDAENFDDITDFLKSCNMTAFIHEPNEEELLRCYELIQRTNQLNISAERLSFEEIKEIVSSEKYDCYRIKVSDKYGDYGLVGFAVFNVLDKENLVLNHFVFSCRAARKRIEQGFFEYIIERYKQKGYKHLILTCKRTERNQLMQSVLEECGLFAKKELSSEAFLLINDMNKKFKLQNIIQFKDL